MYHAPLQGGRQGRRPLSGRGQEGYIRSTMAAGATQWLEQVAAVERRGELLSAVDLAERGLEEHPSDTALQYRAVLALARAGSTAEAARRFEKYGLGSLDDEDAQALGARIAKDVALATTGEEQRRLALRSAELYGGVFDRTGGYYPAVNAATLRLLAGDRRTSRALARRVLELLANGSATGYYAAATEAEARLLLGDEPGAREALARAAELHGGDYGAVATTRRQLRLVCEHTGIDPDLLAILAGPRVVHYCGHRLAPDGDGPLTSGAVPAVTAAIRDELDRHLAAYAYGSLASGADILWAEALLASGAELHVVLPFARQEFIKASVADAGPDWVERFEHCLAAAHEVTYATDDAFLGDDVLYRYGSELAMGLALLHGRYLDSDVRQLALWNGAPARGAAGTAIDVETWRRTGQPTVVVAPAPAADAPPPPEPTPRRGRRVVRALLFADVRGFSTLTDEQLPRFAEHVLGAFADVFVRHAGSVCYRNTWGDGLYVVLQDVVAAAAFALELQHHLAALDLEAHALPNRLGLRVGAHVGPVFPLHDPVLGVGAFMGSHVSRTARIEPVTPIGAVYVTEPFAAAIELIGAPYSCDYVGHMPAAKDFGRLRMYRLRPAASGRQGSSSEPHR
jgi:class 3 adenylate cyclase